MKWKKNQHLCTYVFKTLVIQISIFWYFSRNRLSELGYPKAAENIVRFPISSFHAEHPSMYFCKKSGSVSLDRSFLAGRNSLSKKQKTCSFPTDNIFSLQLTKGRWAAWTSAFFPSPWFIMIDPANEILTRSIF